MTPDESEVGDGGVREGYGGLGWETFHFTDNIDIDGDIFGPLLDMDYAAALEPDKEFMATMPWDATPELSITPLSNALESAGQERGRDSGESDGTSRTSGRQALEEASSPSSGSVGLESPKGLAQTRKPSGPPPSPRVSGAFSATNAEDGPFGGVPREAQQSIVTGPISRATAAYFEVLSDDTDDGESSESTNESQTSQDQSVARELHLSKKRKKPEPKTEGTDLDGGRSVFDQPAKFAKIARDNGTNTPKLSSPRSPSLQASYLPPPVSMGYRSDIFHFPAAISAATSEQKQQQQKVPSLRAKLQGENTPKLSSPRSPSLQASYLPPPVSMGYRSDIFHFPAAKQQQQKAPSISMDRSGGYGETFFDDTEKPLPSWDASEVLEQGHIDGGFTPFPQQPSQQQYQRHRQR